MNPNQALWEKGDFTRVAQSMRRSGELVVNGLGITKGLKVLDLGCGAGTTALAGAPCLATAEPLPARTGAVVHWATPVTRSIACASAPIAGGSDRQPASSKTVLVADPGR